MKLLNWIKKIGKLNRAQNKPMGKPVRKFTRMAIPLAPPGAILAGAAKLLIPTVYRKIPTTFRTITAFVFFSFTFVFVPPQGGFPLYLLRIFSMRSTLPTL